MMTFVLFFCRDCDICGLCINDNKNPDYGEWNATQSDDFEDYGNNARIGRFKRQADDENVVEVVKRCIRFSVK